MSASSHPLLATFAAAVLACAALPAIAQTGGAAPPARTPDTGGNAGGSPGAGAGAGTTAGGSTANAPRTPAGDNQPAPMVMLVPVEISSKAVASGCWVQMYDERNFKGDMLTIAGPSEIQAMDDASGRAFKHRIDSLTVGPKATLTVYEHRLFKDRSAVFGPNSREAGLVRKLGFGGRVQSMRVDCASS